MTTGFAHFWMQVDELLKLIMNQNVRLSPWPSAARVRAKYSGKSDLVGVRS